MELKITDCACNRVKEMLNMQSNKDKIALRISVNGGGCSGFMYDYKLTNKIKNDDYVLVQNAVKVVVDPLSQQFLNGCIIDFIIELGASYFQINNPNVSAKCGCGNSFAI